jgi:hypothetical protein
MILQTKYLIENRIEQLLKASIRTPSSLLLRTPLLSRRGKRTSGRSMPRLKGRPYITTFIVGIARTRAIPGKAGCAILIAAAIRCAGAKSLRRIKMTPAIEEKMQHSGNYHQHWSGSDGEFDPVAWLTEVCDNLEAGHDPVVPAGTSMLKLSELMVIRLEQYRLTQDIAPTGMKEVLDRLEKFLKENNITLPAWW